MPRKPMTEEQKAAARERLAKARAAKAAKAETAEAPVADVAQVPSSKIEPGGFNKGTYLAFPSHASDARNFRSRKIVKPGCQVPDVQEYKGAFKTNMTTGPCQQAILNESRRQFDWFETCTHGPEFTSDGKPIPPKDRPYYEQSTEYVKRPKTVGTDGRVEWEEFEVLRVALRVSDTSIDIRNNSGNAMLWWNARGGRTVESFGVRTYCAYRGCFSQDLQQFSNGQFCTRNHAALVKVYELGDILPLAWDRNNPGMRPSTERRAKMIREVAV